MLILKQVGGFFCAAVVFASVATAQLKTVKIEEFSGYWSGIGTVTWTNGTTEQLKCVATYRPATEQVRQNLRCASQGYSISASVELKFAGEVVTGTWEEKTYSATGAITGKVNDKAARPNTAGTSRTGTISPRGRPRRRATRPMAIINAPPIRTPGTRPARNSAPIEAPDSSA